MGPRTTPGTIRLLSLVVVGSMLLAWAVAAAAVSHRHSAVNGFGTQSEQLVVTAQRIQTELDQADASAANAFLAAGIEPADQRAAYQQALSGAATDIASAARVVDVHVLAQQLPVYAGLVEQARAGNRQGFPIGAAYLRDASSLLRTQLIPAAGAIAQKAAQSLNNSEHGATAWTDVILVLLTGLIALGALGLIQTFLTRSTRRILNIPLVASTIVAAGVLVFLLASMGAERHDIVSANDHGYAPTARLARARALAFEAQADQSEALIAQGSGQAFLADFAAVTNAASGLVSSPAGAPSTDIQPADAPSAIVPSADLQSFVSASNAVASTDAAGKHQAAVAQALASGAGSVRAAFATLDNDLATSIAADQATFASDLSHARSQVTHLPLVAALGAVAAIALALAGAQIRINDYR